MKEEIKMQKNNGRSVFSIIGIVLLILICCPLAAYVAVQYGGLEVSFNNERVVGGSTPTQTPESKETLVPTKREQTLVATKPERTLAVQEENHCAFADGITNAGKEIGLGTKVKGPAIAQLDAERIVVVYPGKEYTVQQVAVVWLYKGDNACLLAQLEFFPGKEIQYIK
ncbi:MAG: hypothetical protein WC981_02735 [Candidatus Dojkabacteria bacterium]